MRAGTFKFKEMRKRSVLKELRQTVEQGSPAERGIGSDDEALSSKLDLVDQSRGREFAIGADDLGRDDGWRGLRIAVIVDREQSAVAQSFEGVCNNKRTVSLGEDLAYPKLTALFRK